MRIVAAVAVEVAVVVADQIVKKFRKLTKNLWLTVRNPNIKLPVNRSLKSVAVDVDLDLMELLQVRALKRMA
jgi:hypothetical protein